MTEQKKGTLSLSCPTSLKKPEFSSEKVRQSFSHGKTKIVTVEVKKIRWNSQQHSKGQIDSSRLGGKGELTNAELEVRVRVVKDAIKENKEQKELRLTQRLEEQKLARVGAAEGDVDPEKYAASAEELKTMTTGEVKGTDKVVVEAKSDNNRGRFPHQRTFKQTKNVGMEEEEQVKENRKVHLVKKDVKELRGQYASKTGRISIYNALDGGDGKTRSLTSIRKARQKNKLKQDNLEELKVIKDVILPETISIQELSSRMAIHTGDVVKALMKLGVMVTANQIIDADTAELIVLELGHKVKRVSDSDVEIGLLQDDNDADLLPRPPVVTVMGHVDHGKTSLLDALRKTTVATTEAGGITQSIGAYQVTVGDGRKITFIDTPGHTAFTEMRSRGANVTDIVVLVVAADDGIKEQTIEAINHAKAAKVPMIVAINKMDKHGANPDSVRKDLLSHEIVVEAYGGEVMDVEISAKSGSNLQKLEETILLQAEVLDLKANPHRTAEGIVIESKVEKGLGSIATVLINKGILKSGDVFVSGTVYGRVRAMRNHRREDIEEISPGMPGEIIGFNGSAVPGDDFVVVGSEAKAKEIAGYRERKKREQAWVVSSCATGSQIFSQLEADKKLQTLSIIVKADVQGSAEAICSSLQKLATEEVAVKIIHSGVGEITENDVSLARASSALLMGFNVRANMQARNQIARDKIQIKYYSVIYDLINDVDALLSGLLTPDIKENILGIAEVRKVFDISKFGRIAGCMVTDGVIRRGMKIRLMRDGVIVYTGDIKSFRRNKDDVKEVKSGFECGISLENYNDIHLNDVIECFELEEIARQLVINAEKKYK
ncbi:MAG: translation initiation factor IF-2 [Holosporaceae bacterium]|jgi:translation initiation factor IF-2|nr:translation initiation factor IF-2 [Holosporaceae bacterium]